MMKRTLTIVLIFLSFQGYSCFILFLSDGTHVLVGNHEDWFAKDAAIKIIPPRQGKYGSVIFTFMSEGWAQGGMNEKGLFFDAAHTPYQDVIFEPTKESFLNYIWQAILDKCSTVDEAVQFLSKYKLPELSESHIMLADATGHAVIVGVDKGKLAIKPFVKDYLMQTNFNPWQPELSDEPVCWRYEKARKQLSIQSASNIENLKSILEQTHQDSLTVYSNIYDLRNKVIYTYNKRDFTKPIVVRLPEIFQIGDCMASLDQLHGVDSYWKNCSSSGRIIFSGKVLDAKTQQPIPFANIGIFEKNIGTLSDPDGSFELPLPAELRNDSIIFSSIGYEQVKVVAGINQVVTLKPNSRILNEVVVSAKKSHTKVARLGWMGGKDGVLPFDTIQGGGAVALLVEALSAPVLVDKLQVRLMYNSKKELALRFHIYTFDSVRQCPGEDLLQQEIILKETKRFGWLRFDLSKYNITIGQKKFFIGFEWIDDRETRNSLLRELREWERWKRDQFKKGNEKIQRIVVKNAEGQEVEKYKYHGNMMNWPGFKNLPPFTGLMIETGKTQKTNQLRTFERKTSMGKWSEMNATLNAVVTISY